MSRKTIADLMTREVVQVAPATPLADCADMMARRRISSLVIGEQQMPLGIVTERDMVKLLGNGTDLALPVGDFMAAPLITAPAETDFRDAVHLLIQHGIRHLAVVDDQGRLNGIVTETDFRRHSGIEEFVGLRTIASIMDTNVLSLRRTATVGDAAVRMHACRASCAIVVDGVKPVGIITERDMVRLYRRQAADMLVGDAMSSPVLSVSPEHLVIDAVQLMQTRGVRHLVVVDDRGDMLATVGEHDVVKHTEGQYIDLLNQIIHEQLDELRQHQAKIAELTYQAALLASENRVLEKQRKLDAIIENALDAIVLMDESGAISGWNHQAETMFGWPRDQALGRKLLETIVPPIYRQQHREGVRAFLASGANRLNMRVETLAIDRQGRHFAVELSVTLVETAQGREFAAFIRDISERKRNEDEMRVASLIYQNSGEAMMVTDANGAILNINPAFTELTGYRLDEVVGKKPRMLNSGRHDAGFYQEMWHRLNTCGAWQGEIWNKRKNGEIFAEWLTINTIFDEAGAPHRRVALFSDITEKKRAEELIWTQANFDPLTGLPNRRMFQEHLSLAVKKSERSGIPLALMFIDLDHFKEINDTLGHDIGDKLLQEAARRLSGSVRATDTVARLGGDEFTVILEDIESPSATSRIAEHILEKLATSFHVEGEVFYISASIGITFYPDDAEALDDLRKNADQAMYDAKHQGRNRYSYFTSDMREVALNRLSIVNGLRQALANAELRLYYQPIVDLRDGSVYKAEALIRWQHPQRGLIGPDIFIPLAEEQGLILDIGDWVFRRAIRQVGEWRERFRPDFQISVNKSPVQFQTDQTFYKNWLQILIDAGLPGDSVTIEITESLTLGGKPIVAEKLQLFRDAGIQVAIDDFGTGYSSLAYLKRYDIDFLKIDRSFVRNLDSNENDRVLCAAMIAMAHTLGMQVIAEGVETERQRDLLAAAGCDFAQGYWYTVPLPADQFEQWLLDSGRANYTK